MLELDEETVGGRFAVRIGIGAESSLAGAITVAYELETGVGGGGLAWIGLDSKTESKNVATGNDRVWNP